MNGADNLDSCALAAVLPNSHQPLASKQFSGWNQWPHCSGSLLLISPLCYPEVVLSPALVAWVSLFLRSEAGSKRKEARLMNLSLVTPRRSLWMIQGALLVYRLLRWEARWSLRSPASQEENRKERSKGRVWFYPPRLKTCYFSIALVIYLYLLLCRQTLMQAKQVLMSPLKYSTKFLNTLNATYCVFFPFNGSSCNFKRMDVLMRKKRMLITQLMLQMHSPFDSWMNEVVLYSLEQATYKTHEGHHQVLLLDPLCYEWNHWGGNSRAVCHLFKRPSSWEMQKSHRKEIITHGRNALK